MPPLFPLTLVLYAATCVLCFVALAQPRLGGRRLILPLLGGGLLSQGADVAWLCLHGQSPGSSAREALYLVSFLILILLGLRSYRQPLPLLGAMVIPGTLILMVLVRALPRPQAATTFPFSSLGTTRLAVLHIFSATLGIALFGIAAATSVAYLLSERRLKQQRLPSLDAAVQEPSLRTLDAWNRQGTVFGLLAFTAALVSGTHWLLESQPTSARLDAPELGTQVRYLLSQPRYTLSVMTWLLFSGLLVARTVFGLRGRWVPQLTLVGFWTSLGVLGVYLFRDVVGLRP